MPSKADLTRNDPLPHSRDYSEKTGRQFQVLLVDAADAPVQPNVLSQCGVIASVGTSTPNFYLHNLSHYDNIYVNREESFHQWKGASRFFICHKSSLMDFRKPLYELFCVTMKVKKCHRPCLLIGSGETLATGIGARRGAT